MKLSPVNTMHLYDPRLRIWVPLCPMMHCRENFPVVNLTNKLYALGGSTLSSTELQPDSLTPVSEAGAQLGRPINMSSGISAAENQVDEPAEGAVVPIDSGAYQSTVPAAPPMTVCLRSCEWLANDSICVCMDEGGRSKLCTRVSDLIFVRLPVNILRFICQSISVHVCQSSEYP